MSADATLALVLRTFDFAETSQVVHLFTLEQGRVHGLAKGARRLNGAFHGGMDVLVLGEVTLYARRPGTELRTLGSFVGISHFPGLRETPARFHAAAHAAALVLAFAREEQPLPELFELTVSLLRLLEEAGDDAAQALALGYEAMLLRHLGFGPELTRCVKCERPARNIRVTRLSPARGGLLCRVCSPDDARAARLSGLAVASLVGLSEGPLTRTAGLPVDRELRAELREALDRWTTYVLDRPLRTAAFL